jgi:hypothetical protein
MNRYDIMLGAISVKMILKKLRPLIRDKSTKSRVRSENVWARPGPGRPGPGRASDKDAFGQDTAHFEIGGDDQQNSQRGDDEDDVGQHVEQFVDDTAAISGSEPDDHADQCAESGADNANQKGGSETQYELGKDVLPVGRSSKQEL